MDKQKVVNMLNQLEITDFNCENDICYEIYVRNNRNLSDLLWMLEIDESSLSRTENSVDICSVAWDYAKRFDGEKFYT